MSRPRLGHRDSTREAVHRPAPRLAQGACCADAQDSQAAGRAAVSADASEPDIVCSCCGSSLGAKNDNASCDEAPVSKDAGAVTCRVCGLVIDAGVPYPDDLVATPEFVGAKIAFLLER